MKRASGKKNIDIVKGYLEGERPFIQVGYTGDRDKYIIRKEGETWTDSSGKQWIETKTGPQAVTRVMDIIRQEINDKCETCKREIRWGSRQDRKMFHRTKKCFDCQIEEETQLKLKGHYKLYETKKLIENEIGYLNDVKGKLKSGRDYLKDNQTITYVNSNGLVEEWKNESRLELMEEMKKDLETCHEKLKEAKAELEKVNREIAKVLK